MKKETSISHKVFFEEIAVCNRGTARYRLDLARIDKYSVTKDFAAAVCALPVTYQRSSYGRFIDNWGTVCVLILFVAYPLVLKIIFLVILVKVFPPLLP